MFLDPKFLIAFFVGAISALVVAWILGQRWFKTLRKQAGDIEEMARKQAELAAREIRSQAEVEATQLKSAAEQMQHAAAVRQDESQRELTQLRSQLEEERNKVRVQLDTLSRQKSESEAERKKFETYNETLRKRLQRVGRISEEEAKGLFREEILRQSDGDIQAIRKEILRDTEDQYRDEANRILVDTMQRIASRPPNEVSATVVEIPSEDMKGRIIGREGRNIKAFEMATGTTLMIDETPGSILVSSFDPVRREIAKMALDLLVQDGRIHPVSIEETVARVTEEMKDHVIGLGEKAVLKTRLSGVHPEVVQLLGKLHYRLSNNQNTLEHSIEVAFFSSLLASELGMDPELAKRAGLFHDMGKAIEHEYEGSHAVAAARMLQRFGEDARVVNAVAAHHNEVPDESVFAGILKIADGLSAARPGARSDSMDGYIQRVRSLERTARSFDGVVEAYALQAGREIRVIVRPDSIDDDSAKSLARRLRQKIEEELQYPGTIRITVIRETRYVETAK